MVGGQDWEVGYQGSLGSQYSKLATRQGVTLINGSALLTPTSSLSPTNPFGHQVPLEKPQDQHQPQPQIKTTHSHGHFAFIFHEKLFSFRPFAVCQFQERFPLSIIKCSAAVINLFRSIVTTTATRHKIEMH